MVDADYTRCDVFHDGCLLVRGGGGDAIEVRRIIFDDVQRCAGIRGHCRVE